jgi:AraC-like DNA-binding protein
VHSNPVDRLSSLLDRFRVRAKLLHAGPLCGVERFSAAEAVGYLHVLRSGEMRVRHTLRTKASTLPKQIHLQQPTLLLYPRPAQHQFDCPVDGSTQFTCATLEFDGGNRNPLARALPDLVALPLAEVAGLAPALDLLFAEADRASCGQRLLVERLFEVVLIQVLRWILDHPNKAGVQSGLIAGLSEPRIARALVAIHEAPGDAWNLQRMAQCAGMSRSAFAATFKNIVQQTPADYLSDWRMSLAQAQLRAGKAVSVLASELGYANASALSRAFAARTGMSPRDWVRQDAL